MTRKRTLVDVLPLSTPTRYEPLLSFFSCLINLLHNQSYPWPQGKEPWNVENGGIGIAPDDARRIEELQNQLTIKCKEKTALEADITKYKKRISDKDLETANLDTTVKNLEKGVKDLAAKFAKKCIISSFLVLL